MKITSIAFLALSVAAALPCAAFEFEPEAVVIPLGQASKSKWVWDSKSAATNGCTAYFRKTFRVETKPRKAVIDVFFDDGGDLYVNGVKKAVGDITDALKGGENTLAFRYAGTGTATLSDFVDFAGTLMIFR